MSVLSVPEHTEILVSERFSASADSPSISPRHVRVLERFNVAMRRRRGIPPFELGYRSVRSRQHCGVVALGKEAIEVLPKVDFNGSVESNQSARIRLLGMLAFTKKLPIHQAEATRLARQPHALLEVVIRLFCSRALDLVRAGLLHRYEAQEDNLRVLRGKLVLPVHLPRNAAHRERMYCAYDEFTPDNAANRVIKRAARRVEQVTSLSSTQGMLRELLYSLDEVSDCAVTIDEFRAIPKDRSTEAYHDVLELAGMILFGPFPDVVSGETNQVAFLFDMNRLFEEFVGRHMMRLAGPLELEVSLQGPARWLGNEILEGGADEECFRLKPDITLRRGGKFVAVIDTKWKVLRSAKPREDVAESDIYQMLAYMTRYGCQTGGLLFPTPAGADGESVFSKIDVAGKTLVLAGLNLKDLDTVPSQLEKMTRHVIAADVP